MPQTAIKTSTSTITTTKRKKARIEVELEQAVEKCKLAGLDMAADFLQTKPRRTLEQAIISLRYHSE
jgi:hypothetical protein